MKRIGLTGNVASGKSTVARIWADAGVPVVSADELAREAVAPGGPAIAEIRDLFGSAAFTSDGHFDRPRMRELAFKDPAVRRQLETVLHPHIRRLRARWLERMRGEGASIVVSEVPLLFEADMADEFDEVVVVDAPESVREERLVSGRGIQRDEAKRILSAQGDPSLKRARADHVIHNAGSRAELEETALAVLQAIESRQ